MATTKKPKIELIETDNLLPITISNKHQIELALKGQQDKVVEIKGKVSKLNITNETGYKIARDVTKDLNDAIKETKAVIKKIKQPFKDRIDLCSQVEKLIIDDAELILKMADSKIIAWNKKVQEEAAAIAEKLRLEQEAIELKAKNEALAAAAEIARISNIFINYEKEFMEEIYAENITKDRLIELNNIYIESAEQNLAEVYDTHPEEVKQLLERLTNAGSLAYKTLVEKTKLQALKSAAAKLALENLEAKKKADEALQKAELLQKQEEAIEKANFAADEILQDAADKSAEITGSLMLSTKSAGGSGLRDAGWDWEIANDQQDLHMVSKMFLTVDEKAIKEWIRVNKEKLENSEPVKNYPGYSKNEHFVFGGIAFYKKEKTVVHK